MAKNSLDLGSLKIKMELDAAQALKDAQDAGEEITASQQKTVDNLEKLQGEYQEATKKELQDQFNNIKDSAKKVGITVGAAFTAATAAIIKICDDTREYRTELAKLEAAGESNGYTAEYTKSKYMELNAVMNDSTAASTTIANLTAIGLSQDDLQTTLNSCIGVWSKYGDSIPLDGLAESINETIKTAKVTGNLADALNWCGISEDDFNAKLAACSTEQERQQLLVETLDEAYGALGTTYQETNEDIISANAAQQQLDDTMASIGETLEPLNIAFDTFVSTLLVGLKDWLEAHQKEVDAFAAKVQELGNFLVDNGSTIITLASGIGAAMLTWNLAKMISGVVTAVKAYTAANEGASIAQALLNAVMKANPFVLIATLIAGVVTAIIVLWNTNDGFRDAVTKAWDAIKNAVSGTWNAVKGIFQKISDKFREITNIGSNLVVGLWNGINNKVQWIIDKIAGFGTAVLKAMKKIFGIHSPSKETAEIGNYLVKGLAKGIEDTTGLAIAAVNDLCGDVENAFNPSLGFDADNYSLGNRSAIHNAKSSLGNGNTNSNSGKAVNNITQNNYFTAKETSNYEQQVQIKRLQRDLVGGLA
jgi:hypothetical protein